MMSLLLSVIISLGAYFAPVHTASVELCDVRCAHGAEQIPMIVCAPTCVTTCSLITTTTTVIPGASLNASVTVPGPSATYTNLSISGALTANQLCASNVTAANMESLFLSSDYYANMSNYQILRSNASIFSTFGNELILTATDGVVGDLFGSFVDMSGDGSIVVISALNKIPTRQGTVYIYRRQFDTWALIQEIHDPSALNFDNFGISVAISSDGSTIAASNLNDDGTVYLYQYNAAADQWLLAQAISGIGQNVDLSATGQYLVSATSATTAQAFVYVRNDTCAGRGSVWELQQILTPAGASSDATLDAAISADSSTIALGIVDVIARPDTVEMFTRSGTQWSLVQTLTASDAIANDTFGSAVSLSSSGQYLLVGAPLNGSGAVYEFVLRGTFWNQENEFFPSGGALRFGRAVDISADGTVGVIGSILGNPGNAFVIVRSPDNYWTMPSIFTGHAATANFGFSCACSADGAFIVVGAPDLIFATQGSASIFRPVSALIPADTIITGSLCVNVNMIVDADVLVTGSVFIQGSIITGGATPCLTPSDRRLKRDIEPLSAHVAFERLQQLRPVTFSWAHPEEHPGESNPSAGLIAQEVERYFPHWIRRGQARGKDAQLVSTTEPARLIEITPELYAYIVAAIKGLEESDAYKDKLMSMYQARCTAE